MFIGKAQTKHTKENRIPWETRYNTAADRYYMEDTMLLVKYGYCIHPTNTQ